MTLAVLTLLMNGSGGVAFGAMGEKIELKGGTPWGEAHRNSIGLSFFAKRLSELTDGDVTVKKFFGGSIVKGKTEIDTLKNRVVDIASVTVPYHPGIIPDYVRVSITVPFVADFNSWFWLWENTGWYSDYLKKLGLHPLYACYGELIIGLVDPLEDIMAPSFKGRKLRAPGLGFTEFVKILGGDTITMPSAEAPAALATGLAQGIYTTLDSWEALGIQNVCPNVYILNVPFATMHCMTEARYASLSERTRNAIDKAAAETTKNQINWARNYRDKLLEKYQGHAKVRLNVLNDAQMAAWMTALKPFYEWIMEKYDPEMSQYLEDCRKAWRETHTTEPPSIK
jgi:TRAP-type C4-dicarboxylate transport system substrate-binding protein